MFHQRYQENAINTFSMGQSTLPIYICAIHQMFNILIFTLDISITIKTQRKNNENREKW